MGNYLEAGGICKELPQQPTSQGLRVIVMAIICYHLKVDNNNKGVIIKGNKEEGRVDRLRDKLLLLVTLLFIDVID